MFDGPRTYRVQRADRKPLVNFMRNALEAEGCRIIQASEPNRAPSRSRLGLANEWAWLPMPFSQLQHRPPTVPLTRRSFQDAPTDFDVVAACLHAVTEKWEFRYILSGELPLT